MRWLVKEVLDSCFIVKHTLCRSSTLHHFVDILSNDLCWMKSKILIYKDFEENNPFLHTSPGFLPVSQNSFLFNNQSFPSLAFPCLPLSSLALPCLALPCLAFPSLLWCWDSFLCPETHRTMDFTFYTVVGLKLHIFRKSCFSSTRRSTCKETWEVFALSTALKSQSCPGPTAIPGFQDPLVKRRSLRLTSVSWKLAALAHWPQGRESFKSTSWLAPHPCQQTEKECSWIHMALNWRFPAGYISSNMVIRCFGQEALAYKVSSSMPTVCTCIWNLRCASQFCGLCTLQNLKPQKVSAQAWVL